MKETEVFKGWETTIPKIRQAFSNVQFYIELNEKIDKDELKILITALWNVILEETNDVKEGMKK